MSYAIAPTFEANKIGVRRVYTLAGIRGMGDVADTEQGMITDGYDAGTIQSLVALGATDAQLQGLWDNYGANTQEFSDAAQSLMMQLSAPSMASPLTMNTSTAGTAYAAASAAASTVIQVAGWGLSLDLSEDSSWSTINGLFTQVEGELNSVVQLQNGKPDAETVGQIQAFNSLVAQWAEYYAQVYGTAPSPLPLVSQTGLSGLGLAPVAVLGIAGVIAAMLVTLYGFYTFAQLKKAQYAAQTQNAAITGVQGAAAALLARADAADKTDPALAASLRKQAAALLGQTLTSTTPAPAATSALATWFTQNWIGVAAVVIGIAVLPPLVKKL